MIKSSLYILLGNVIFSFSQWFIVTNMARNNELSLLGEYTYILSVITPMTICFGLNLRSYVTVNNLNKNEREKIYNLIFLSSCSFFVCSSLYFIFSSIRLSGLFLFIAVFLLKFSDLLFETFSGFRQRDNNYKQIGLSKGIRALVVIVLFMIITYLYNTYYAILAISFLSIIYVIFIDVYPLLNMTVLKFDFLFYKKTIKHLFPLTLGTIIDSFQLNVQRYFLRGIGFSSIGVYSALIYFMIAGGILLNAISSVLIKRLSDLSDNNNQKEFINLILKFSAISFVLGIIGIIVSFFYGHVLLTIIYGTEFSQYTRELNVVMISALFWFLSGFIYCGLIAKHKYHTILFINVTALILLVMICLFMNITLFNVLIATLISYIYKFIASVFIFYSYFRKIKD
ncbi:MATE family efflux transporter [Photobacterium damselae]